MGSNHAAATAPAVHASPTMLDDHGASSAALDCAARCMGFTDWAALRVASDRPSSAPLRPLPAFAETVSLMFAQDRALLVARAGVALEEERAEIAAGIAIVGVPDLSGTPVRHGITSVEFQHALLGEAYALERARYLRRDYDPVDVREWIGGYAGLPGCWKVPAPARGITVSDALQWAEAASILPHMVWVYGECYDVARGGHRVASLPALEV